MSAAKKGELVPRPAKKVEYEIRFATADSRKGWRDLVATIRNPMSETWDFLTHTPLETTPTNYRLKGELGTVFRGGSSYERWCGSGEEPHLRASRMSLLGGRTVSRHSNHGAWPNHPAG